MAYDQNPKQTINNTDVVPIVSAAFQANTTGTVTSSTSTITATDLRGVGSVTVGISGTFAGVNVIFEYSPDAGTTWYPIGAQNASTGATATTSGVIAAAVSYSVSPLLGADQFRVRTTAYTSGTANVVIHPSTQFITPWQTVNGTVSAAQSGTWNISTITGNMIPGTSATHLGKAEDAAHTSGDTGVAIWAVRNDNVAVTHTSANGDYSPISTDAVGTQFTRHSPATTATKSTVSPATTSTTLVAANAARRSVVLVNAGTTDCYVSYGGTASTTSYTFILPSLGTTTILGSEYAGLIVGIWSGTGGNPMQITETTI